MKKAVMILCDGMRPDAMLQCGNPYVTELLNESKYTLEARTVWPSVTLPCHMSLFHSVDPERHGTTDNVYMRQVRPIRGLIDKLAKCKKKNGMFYSWEELRDVCRFDRLDESYMYSLHNHGYDYRDVDKTVTDRAIEYIGRRKPDFVFLYLCGPDDIGHGSGWMSQDYLDSISFDFDQIKRVRESLTDDYFTVVLADHGGHGRSHGSTDPEDMTIPVIFTGKDFAPGKFEGDVNIKDIAPTVAKLLEVENEPEWEGRFLF